MMRIELAHFWPRYGMAVAVHRANTNVPAVEKLSDRELANILAFTIERELDNVMLFTRHDPRRDEMLMFEYIGRDRLALGSENNGRKQNAANGYYLAPHVATSNNAAPLVQKALLIVDVLRGKEVDLEKKKGGKDGWALQRSFAPLVSKVNNGQPSMTDPPATLLEAACFSIATLTQIKPGSYSLPPTQNDPKKKSNHVLIPDLPLYDRETGCEPLVDFVRLFDSILAKNVSRGRFAAKRGKVKEKELKGGNKEIVYSYSRPPIFYGNYPDAPRDPTLGPLGVLAAIGVWAREAEIFLSESRGAFAERTLEYLTDNPLYIVSYDGRKQQEHLGHHLVRIAMDARYQLPRLIDSFNRIKLYNEDPQSERLFRMIAARFIQSFEPAAFRDFLVFRAEYDSAFTLLLEEYFMAKTMADLPSDRRKEIVASARAFGAALNLAAYRAALDEVEDDKRRGRQIRTLTEYKARKLIVLESAALSARSHGEMLEQLMIRAGRETGGRDLEPEAGLFMEAVAAQEISLEEAKQLAIAFMRLRKVEAKDTDIEPPIETDEEESALAAEPEPEL